MIINLLLRELTVLQILVLYLRQNAARFGPQVEEFVLMHHVDLNFLRNLCKGVEDGLGVEIVRAGKELVNLVALLVYVF